MLWNRRRFLRHAGALIAWLTGATSSHAQPERPPRLHQIHDETRNTRLRLAEGLLRKLRGNSLRRKRYAGSVRFDLSAPRARVDLPLAAAARNYSPAVGFAGKPITLPELARLLHLTNGVTGRLGRGRREVKLRAAPSAGALYAGEVYVVAERVAGLEPGVYYFSPLGAQLVRLRRGSALGAVGEALEYPGRIGGAAAVVLLTNVFARYRSQYGPRGYRYALIDSGHIGENLRLAAASRGLAEWGPLRFHDDRLHALLEIDGVDEAVCAVHAIGQPAPSGAPVESSRHLSEKGRTASPRIEAAYDTVERYHEATKLAANGGSVRDLSPAETEMVAGESGELRTLPLAEPPPPLATGEAIEHRRSALVYVTENISLEDFAFVLETADGHSALRRAPSVELHVAVHRVAGLAPGLYRFVPGARALSLRRTGDLSKLLVEACLGQDKAGSAAAACFMVGHLHAAAARGDRAYRDLLIEAGAIGQRIYLSAVAAGLAARNLAAFFDDDLNSLLRLSPPERAVLHLTLLGREAAE